VTSSLSPTSARVLCHLSLHGGGVIGNGEVSKHAVDIETISRLSNGWQRMAGRDNVSEALALRIVRVRSLSGSKAPDPKMGTGIRFGGF
jgi:hypothetical protein